MKTKTYLSLLAAFAASALVAATPVIKADSVTFSQNTTTRLVTIGYTLEETDAVVTVDVLTNGVSIGAENFANIDGDVNRRVVPGDHLIVWHPRSGSLPAALARVPFSSLARKPTSLLIMLGVRRIITASSVALELNCPIRLDSMIYMAMVGNGALTGRGASRQILLWSPSDRKMGRLIRTGVSDVAAIMGVGLIHAVPPRSTLSHLLGDTVTASSVHRH